MAMILIPVKNWGHAKQRLSSILSPAERSALGEAMLHDVFETLAGWRNRPPVAVVTSEPRALRLARGFSFEVIEDAANQGETDAIAMATRVCECRKISSTLVIPGDIPLLKVSELEGVLAAAPSEGAVLVPSYDGLGTNAAFRRPAGLFSLRFGGSSFDPHVRAAQATGRPCVTLQLPGIALDIDTPADLALLLAAENDTRAQQLLRVWKVTERLAPAVIG